MAPKKIIRRLPCYTTAICLGIWLSIISISFNRAKLYERKPDKSYTSRYGISSKISWRELHHDGKLYTLFSLSQVNRKDALPQSSTTSPCYKNSLRVLEKFKTLLHGKPYLAIK